MKRTILYLFFVFITTLSQAQQISQYTSRLNNNWAYKKYDAGGIWDVIRTYNDGTPWNLPQWQQVTLPHCFNAEDAVMPDVDYYEGPGWYRTALTFDNPYPQGRILLHFEGAGQKTDVYVGMNKVLTHVGGYDEFTADITEAVKKSANDTRITDRDKGKTPLSIRCDNSRDLEMIPSDLSDFNIYGGLYRYVNLVYVPNIYIRQVHVTPTVNKKQGQVKFDIDLVNKHQAVMKMQVTIKSPALKTVYQTTLKTKSNRLSHTVNLNKVDLWHPDSPSLYSIEIKTLGKKGGQEYTDRFGFRNFRFEKKGPFYLNGKRLLLRGTHRHEDHAGVGAAMTEEMTRKEMILMKEMGVNFVRLGHYQQSKIVLNLCDSLGILVWEEIPWCRGGLGGKIYKEQAKRMLTNMVNQHYNHPAVILWGLGNENDWEGDFPEFNEEKIRVFMHELHNLSHRLDNTRMTSIRRCHFCTDVPDVYSPSIWAGWYRGKYTEYKQSSYENMQAVDHFLHAEYGGSSHAGRHDENPDVGLEHVQTGQGTDERAGDFKLHGGSARVSKDGNWSETYICNLFDWHLKEQLTMPWLTGAAQWAFKDFSTPLRPSNPIPYVNQKGVVERDFTPKESYYVFQSYWTNKPMVHIYGHSWPTRWGAAGEARMVKVYSNCKQVELILNGKSLGTKKRNTTKFPACGLFWHAPFREGKNSLKAIAKIAGKTITDEINFTYQTEKWDTPARLLVREISIDKQYSWLEVKAVDAKGTLCLDANNRVRYAAAGDATLIKHQGTSTGSQTVELCNGVGRIKVKRNGPHYTLSVSSDNLPTAVIIGGK